MLLLRTLPYLADTPANRDFRRYFYSKWGKENCIISARERRAEYPMFTQCLSVKAAWGGSERYFLDGRTVAVDDDNYLIVNDRRTYASTLISNQPVHTASIFFRPGLPEESLGALLTPADRVLDSGDEPVQRAVEFTEQLRPHDTLITPLLRYIAFHVDRDLNDELWYEEQLSFLLERMLRAHRACLSAIGPINAARHSTRREIVKRIGWSTDYINTYYARRLGIGELAKAASMSRVHFIRLFRAVHGMTPFAYVQRKRATVARRLLLSTNLSQAAITLQVGFESRSTLFRCLKRLTGSGARALRRGTPLSRRARQAPVSD
jgi:AraC-like DNA-binding protein